MHPYCSNARLQGCAGVNIMTQRTRQLSSIAQFMTMLIDGELKCYRCSCQVSCVIMCMRDRLGKVLRKSLIRPFVILIHEPIIQLFGAYMAFVYGTMYRTSYISGLALHTTDSYPTHPSSVFLTTMPLIYQGVYHQSIGIAGLHYFALGIGMVGLSQINAQYIDRIYIYLRNRYGGVDQPEYRLRERHRNLPHISSFF